MRNKKVLFVLTIVAIIIWGYNAYVLKSGMGYEELTIAGETHSKKAKETLKAYVFDEKVRDPFKPPIYQTPKPKKVKRPAKKKIVIQPPPLVIDGILWDDKNPTAVLKNRNNGDVKIVEKGTVWGDVTILKITKTEVRVRYKNKSFVIK